MAPYSLDLRVNQLFQRRLINPSPFHPTSRYHWIYDTPYQDPNWYPGSAQTQAIPTNFPNKRNLLGIVRGA